MLTLLSGCGEEEYFTSAWPDEHKLVKGRADDGNADLYGKEFANLRQRAGDKYSDLRLRKHGRFFNLDIHDTELVDWRYIEGASIRSLDLMGKSIPPESWQWLKTVRDFDNDLSIELTDQKLDDAFYDELNGLLEGRRMDTLSVSVPGFNACELAGSGQHVNNFRIKNSSLSARYAQNPDWYVSFISERLSVANQNPSLEEFVKKCAKGEIQ